MLRGCENNAFGKRCSCVSDTRHFHNGQFPGSEEQNHSFLVARMQKRNRHHFHQNHLYSVGAKSTVFQGNASLFTRIELDSGKVSKKSGDSLKKVPKKLFRDFFQTRGRRPRETFSDFFGISGPEGPRDPCKWSTGPPP